jgi:Skp family chaperone for outer membrane proteins
MTKDINAQYAQYKELADQAKDPMTTADAKAKAESDAQKLGAQIQQKLNDRNQFGQQVQQEFQKRVQSFHEMLIDQISQKAVEIAKSHGATLLLDKSGIGMLATKAILYSDPSYDITDEVAAAIDKDRPASAPAASAPMAPSTPAAPAAPSSDSGPPPITVPGVTAPAQ